MQMLSAVVEHPETYQNRIGVEHASVHGNYEYFLVEQAGAASTPFPQYGVLSMQVMPVLVHYGFVEKDGTDGWYRFTNKAIDWYRERGVSNHEIQKRIGEALFERYGRDVDYPTADELVVLLGVTPDRVHRNLEILVDLGYVLPDLHVWMDGMPPPPPSTYALSRSTGLLWANGGFRPIGLDPVPVVNVEVRNEINIAISEARAGDVPRELLERFEARFRRIEEELEKPQGRFEPVKEMMETANQSKDLLGPAVRFLFRNWDKIQQLGETASATADKLF